LTPTLQPQPPEVVIRYTYDPLYRLTAADYSNGRYFHYTYDSVGNRLTETTALGTTNYTYDTANRLTYVGSTPYTWDNNGNLLSDGMNTLTYDHANRLTGISGQSAVVSFAYNGLGDRLRQTVNEVVTQYTPDLNAGLTQVLSDGTNTYLYGVGRIAQYTTYSTDYFLGDALGSVRQLADHTGVTTLSRNYEPYGEVLNSAGSATTNYGFTGEWTDATGMVYLRARYYEPGTGRFITRDVWEGDHTRPLSLNKWNYVNENPVNRIDPTGHCGFVAFEGDPNDLCWKALHSLQNDFQFVDLETDVNWFSDNIWTTEEINHVRSELETLDRVAQVDLHHIFGPGKIRIKRETKTGPCGISLPWSRILLYDSAFTNPFCTGTVGHELAHQWDDKWRVSVYFEKYIGASTLLFFYNPGPESPPIYIEGRRVPNRKEDFAESLLEFVYNDPLTGIVVGEKRWEFINVLLSTGEMLIPFEPTLIPVPEPSMPIPVCTPVPSLGF
jgi:RHS repeat-associated protein